MKDRKETTSPLPRAARPKASSLGLSDPRSKTHGWAFGLRSSELWGCRASWF